MIHHQPVHRNNRGFSLIEMLIYIALMTIIVGGAIVASYPLFTGADRSFTNVATDIEAGFLARKITWAIAAGDSVSVPAAGASGSSLTVAASTGNVSFSVSGDNVSISRGAGAVPLLSSRTAVTNLSFAHTAAAGTVPAAIEFSFDLNGRHFGPIKYYGHNI
jgi:prepilin-type N-terminal cleavage/methylation domain-containing protein